MPDNTEPEVFEPLFPTQVFTHSDECDNPECAEDEEAQAAIFLTARQLDALTMIAQDALEYRILDDEFEFPNGNAEGHMSISTMMATALVGYFSALADIVAGNTWEDREEELHAILEEMSESRPDE